MFSSKYDEEFYFHMSIIPKIIRWYNGEIDCLYDVKRPEESQKVKESNLKDSAILTFIKLCQWPRYLQELDLKKDAFSGTGRVLEIGSGSMPGSTVFEGCELYCLDPLNQKYMEAGFPFHHFGNIRLITGFAENIPIADNFFDAVISVNAIDHVDDLSKVSLEIRRVLKDNGKLAIQVNYHKPYKTEPMKINDGVIKREFSWCKGFRKIREAADCVGIEARSGESYALWKNF